MSILGDAIAKRVFSDVSVFPRELAAMIGAYAEHRVVRFARAPDSSSGEDVLIDGPADERATVWNDAKYVCIPSTDPVAALPRRWALKVVRMHFSVAYFGVIRSRNPKPTLDWDASASVLVDDYGAVFIENAERRQTWRWHWNHDIVIEFELDPCNAELRAWPRGHSCMLARLPLTTLGPASTLYWVVRARCHGNQVELVEPQDEPPHDRPND